MSSNAPTCCFVDVFEEHLSSMRFLSLRMKLSLDLVGIADWWGGTGGREPGRIGGGRGTGDGRGKGGRREF